MMILRRVLVNYWNNGGKGFPIHAMKGNVTGVKVQLHIILTSALGGEWFDFTLHPLYRRERIPVRFEWEVGKVPGPVSTSGRRKNLLPLSGFETHLVKKFISKMYVESVAVV